MSKIRIKQVHYDNMVRATTMSMLSSMMATLDRNAGVHLDLVVKKAKGVAMAYLNEFYEVEHDE